MPPAERRWWRTLGAEDAVTVAWQFTPDPDREITFSALLSGRRTISTEQFISAITDFDHQLLRPMQERVDHLAVAGAAPGIELDIRVLIREQAQAGRGCRGRTTPTGPLYVQARRVLAPYLA
ncbi:DUF5984 family protein [Nocardia beijingensis]|uniref:DUF5984 family protein n=1 Tax=Nocardia beijingensis TaxID=95162 RepID=UPI0033DBBE62